MAANGWLCRVASHPKWGGGHMSRCRALGKALLTYGPVSMMLDPGGEQWGDIVAHDGFEVRFAEEDGFGDGWRGCLADGYAFTVEELALLKRASGCLAAFEDGLQPAPPVDLAINAAPGLDGDRLGATPALLGARYATVAETFVGVGRPRPRAAIRNILVTFGYMDDCDLCGRTLDALETLKPAVGALQVAVAIGSRAKGLPALRDRARRHRCGISVLVEAGNMIELLREADLAIGAGGVSLFERMAAGVPSISIATAGNQRLMVEGAAAAQATVYLGRHDDVAAKDIAAAVERLASRPAERAQLAARGRELVDGQGAARTAAALHEFALGRAMATEGGR